MNNVRYSLVHPLKRQVEVKTTGLSSHFGQDLALQSWTDHLASLLFCSIVCKCRLFYIVPKIAGKELCPSYLSAKQCGAHINNSQTSESICSSRLLNFIFLILISANQDWKRFWLVWVEAQGISWPISFDYYLVWFGWRGRELYKCHCGEPLSPGN